MKVKDLLKSLEGCDPEASITFDMSVGCCGDTYELELEEDEIEYSIFPGDEHHVNIRFDPMPGYYSCLQMGGTIKRHDEYWEKYKPEYMVNKPKEPKLEVHADGVKETK